MGSVTFGPSSAVTTGPSSAATNGPSSSALKSGPLSLTRRSVSDRARAFALALLFVASTSLALVAQPVGAVDGDGDGLDDTAESCPFAAGNSTVGLVGCPDADGDGVPDSMGTSTSNLSRMVQIAAGTGWFQDLSKPRFSPDGTGFIVTQPNSTSLWQHQADGVVGGPFIQYGVQPNVTAFSPDGQWLLVAGFAGSAHLHEWPTGAQTRDLSGFSVSNHRSAAWAPNGSVVALGDDDGTVRLIDPFNGTEVANWTVHGTRDVQGLAWSPDGRLLASGATLPPPIWGEPGSHTLEVTWVHNQTRGWNSSGNGSLNAVSWTPDGRFLLVGTDGDGFNVTWAANGSVDRRVDDLDADVNDFAFSPAGDLVAVASANESVRAYRLSDWSLHSTMGAFPGWNGWYSGTEHVSWWPDGDALLVRAASGNWTLWLDSELIVDLPGTRAAAQVVELWSIGKPPGTSHVRWSEAGAADVTRDLCLAGANELGLLVGPLPRDEATPAGDAAVSGNHSCASSPAVVQSVSVGRLPTVVFVRAGGATQQCVEAIGGLSLAQVRWMFTDASDGELGQAGGQPALDLASVAPNDDHDGKREWGDLSSAGACQDEVVVTAGGHDNDSASVSFGASVLCWRCAHSEGWQDGGPGRVAHVRANGSTLATVISQDQWRAGVAAMGDVATQGAFVVPLVANRTHGAADALAAGGVAWNATVDNSSNGTWPLQVDLALHGTPARVAQHTVFLSWLLGDGQATLAGSTLQPLGAWDRVLMFARLGQNRSDLLTDADGDGLWDGADRCAGTAPGAAVDAYGCSAAQRDTDGDGVSDDVDRCATTPAGAAVDGEGCADSERDTDGDGIPDDVDQCAGSVDPATVDVNGCDATQRDGDADGVPDASDQCPFTLLPDDVDATGCDPTQGDSDDDGVVDADDACPLTSVNATVDGHGCSLGQRDSDDDGVFDDVDTCAATPASDTADAAGCGESQRDTDGDGVMDATDACVATPENASVDSSGCAPSQLDSDGDGLTDDVDACADTPVFDRPNLSADGCSRTQIDTDGDGVMDPFDAWVDDPTQFSDVDGDGFGDNQSAAATLPDHCPGQRGTSTELGHLGCPDRDGDGYWNIDDDLPDDPLQWRDSDGDGLGDNWGDPNWNVSRGVDWPGVFDVRITDGDRCPTTYYASEDGCPFEEGAGGGVQSGSGSGTSWVLIGAGVGGLALVALLGVLIVLVLNPPKKKGKGRRKRPAQGGGPRGPRPPEGL